MGERRKKRFVDPSKGHPNDRFYGVPLWMRRLEKKMAKRRDPNEVVDGFVIIRRKGASCIVQRT